MNNLKMFLLAMALTLATTVAFTITAPKVASSSTALSYYETMSPHRSSGGYGYGTRSMDRYDNRRSRNRYDDDMYGDYASGGYSRRNRRSMDYGRGFGGDRYGYGMDRSGYGRGSYNNQYDGYSSGRYPNERRSYNGYGGGYERDSYGSYGGGFSQRNSFNDRMGYGGNYNSNNGYGRGRNGGRGRYNDGYGRGSFGRNYY